MSKQQIMEEIINRLNSIATVACVDRNPGSPPNKENLNAIQIFELDDYVKEIKGRAPNYEYQREAEIVIEPILDAISEESAHTNLADMITEIQTALYGGRPSLGKRCLYIVEYKRGVVFRPPISNFAIGISIFFKVGYIERLTL